MEPSKRAIDWGELIVPALALLFGGAYFVQVRDASWTAIYWPVLIAVFLGVLWVLILRAYVFTEKTSKAKLKIHDRSWLWSMGLKLGLIFFASIGYLIAINYIGYSLCNLCYLLFIFRGLGSRKWIVNITVALTITVFLYLGLIVFMKLSLPLISIGGFNI